MKFKFEAGVSYCCDGEVEADTRENAVLKFEDEADDSKHVRITSINGIEVIGRCEVEGNYILEGENTGPYVDVMLCRKCINDGAEF